jgi:protein tyrosine phosphatase (PTP) superfamily phosphohydrolase (DUF442 family)
MLLATGAADHSASSPPDIGQPLPVRHLDHVIRATTNIISGGSPQGENAFAEIARFGVKTIISVDGSKPDAETARKHGLRYIHLPLGYDGVPAHRVAELIKAVQSTDRPIYVHCHRGHHRGPTAVALMCEAAAGWTTNQAVGWLKQAGTSTDYPGLYRSVLQFQSPSLETLSQISELPEITKTSSLVQAMVQIGSQFDQLRSAQQTGWPRAESGAEPTTVQAAILLWECLRELSRTQESAAHPSDYRLKLKSAVSSAGELRELLRATGSKTRTLDGVFSSIEKSCSACHRRYRN